jgi:hypothetical protein
MWVLAKTNGKHRASLSGEGLVKGLINLDTAQRIFVHLSEIRVDRGTSSVLVAVEDSPEAAQEFFGKIIMAINGASSTQVLDLNAL